MILLYFMFNDVVKCCKKYKLNEMENIFDFLII